MNRDEVIELASTFRQVNAVYDEMDGLSKRKPNDLLNVFKLGIVNAVLQRANGVVGEARLPIPGFATFSQEEPPSNSDALVVLRLYKSELEKIRHENVTRHSLKDWWVIDGRQSDLEA